MVTHALQLIGPHCGRQTYLVNVYMSQQVWQYAIDIAMSLLDS